MGNNKANLPPGFQFCPTDEELVVHFLQRKHSLLPYCPDIIPDLHLYPYDPWELDGKAMLEGRKWYYYSRKTSKRMTENGYWKASDDDEDEEIISDDDGGRRVRIGVKKCYVFHVGEEGIKTNWKMEEFRLSNASAGTSKRRSCHSNTDYSKWVICRVFEHDDGNDNDDDDGGVELSSLDEAFLSMDDFDELSS